MNPTQRLKGVCIGAGYFSHFQYEAWTRIPEVEIVAFSNRDPVKAAEITKRFGHTKLSADDHDAPWLQALVAHAKKHA